MIQITELIMYFLQFQCENSWTLSSDLFNPSHAVRDLSRVRQYPPWLLFWTSRLLSIPWGTQGTSRRRHANNDAREIDNFIGCEGDFLI